MISQQKSRMKLPGSLTPSPPPRRGSGRIRSGNHSVPQTELKKLLAETGMALMAWYPLGHGDKSLINEPIFTELAKKYGKTNAQIILRWHIQSGNVVIPGSKNPEHIRDNFDIFDFALTDEDMLKIAAVNKNKRYYTATPEMVENYAKMQLGPDL